MREILFRGQTRKYGELVRMGDGEKLPGNWAYGGIFPGTGDYSVIYGWESGDEHTGATLKKLTVYSDTVGQHTGLPDRNEKQIFEGDILESQIGDRHRWVVSYVDGGFEIAQIGVKPKKRRYQANTDLLCADNIAFYELVVIGNIYDNPELLEEKPT